MKLIGAWSLCRSITLCNSQIALLYYSTLSSTILSNWLAVLQSQQSTQSARRKDAMKDQLEQSGREQRELSTELAGLEAELEPVSRHLQLIAD